MCPFRIALTAPAVVASFVLVLLLNPVAAAQTGLPDPDAVLEQAQVLVARGDYKQAIEMLAKLQPRGDLSPLQKARLYARMAVARVETSQYEAAGQAIATSEALAQGLGATDLLAHLESTKGSSWRHRGYPLRAAEHYRKSLELAEQIRDPILVSRAYVLLASTYQLMGDWSRVLYYVDRQFETHPNPSAQDRFRNLAQRAIAYYEFYDRDRAVASFEAALRLAQDVGDRRGMSFALGELGLVAWEFDRDRTRALGYYDRAIAIARAISVPNLEITWLTNSGNVFRDSGEFAEALARYHRALAIERRLGQEGTVPTLLKNIGQVLRELQRPAEAEPVLLQALEAADRLNKPAQRWQARMELGRLYSNSDPAKADRYLRETLDVLEEHHNNVLLEHFRTGTLARSLNRYDPYDRYIEFLLEREDRRAAFLVAERARARVFLETLAAAREQLAQTVPAAYLEAENGLLQRITDQQSRLHRQQLGASERHAIASSVAEDEEKLRTLRLRLSLEQPKVAQARYPKLWAAAELQSTVLGPNDALLMFFVGSQRSSVWIVTRQAMELVSLPARNALEEAVRDHLRRIETPSNDEARETPLSRMLSEMVAAIPQGSRLVIVPHGPLHYVPFETLTDREGEYLVRRHVISYAPSASSYAYLRGLQESAATDAGVVVVGNPVLGSGESSGREAAPATERGVELAWVGLLKPLPHSGAELRRIAAVFPSVTRVLERGSASEEVLQTTSLQHSRILHFATHGLIDAEHPERSGLALTPNPPTYDGVLQTREIYRLKLSGALVTLSACQTAIGKNVAGEGIVGLARAFFYAGANAVVGSLWNVNDASTVELMTRFYEGLRRGASIDTALQQAKIAFLDGDAKFRHPYYWAPFIATGDATRTIDIRRPWTWQAALIPLLVVVAALAYLVRAGRRERRET